MHCKPFPLCTNPIYLYLNSNMTQPQSTCHATFMSVEKYGYKCFATLLFRGAPNPIQNIFSFQSCAQSQSYLSVKKVSLLPGFIASFPHSKPKQCPLSQPLQCEEIRLLAFRVLATSFFTPTPPPPLSPGFLFIILEVATFKRHFLSLQLV